MQGILYDATKVKVCQAFYDVCNYAELPSQWADELWMDILSRKQIYKELVYYIEHHTFLDELKVCGYSLCDLYVWQMNRYNLIKDTGKNSRTCNKEKMAMQAFRTMVDLMENPEVYRKRLEEGQGTDKM
ncbi:MAG: hypothetical protein K2O16_06965 [Lachnospiraceae bacterium]|nr:hypothetical protein [Lachnospiraceae bacterium]MDE7331972.1 hypothetical protein [Lachnospiraceae bacterium]